MDIEAAKGKKGAKPKKSKYALKKAMRLGTGCEVIELPETQQEGGEECGNKVDADGCQLGSRTATDHEDRDHGASHW